MENIPYNADLDSAMEAQKKKGRRIKKSEE
jgi:hypothetical protein